MASLRLQVRGGYKRYQCHPAVLDGTSNNTTHAATVTSASTERVQQFVDQYSRCCVNESATPAFVHQAMFLGIEGISTSNIHKLRKELRNEHRDSGDYLVVVVPPHSIMTVLKLLLDTQENSHAARTNEHVELFTKAVERNAGRVKIDYLQTNSPNDRQGNHRGGESSGPASSSQPLLLILKASPAARPHDFSLQQLWKDVLKPILTTRRTKPPILGFSTAPHDVYVPVGSTGCAPQYTSWFQVANIPTKIRCGVIEVLPHTAGNDGDGGNKKRRDTSSSEDGDDDMFFSGGGNYSREQHLLLSKGQKLSTTLHKVLNLELFDMPKLIGAFDFSQQSGDALRWYPPRVITTNWERHIKDASTQLVCLAAAVGALPSQHDDDEEPSSFSTFARHVQNKFAAEHSRLLAREQARMRDDEMYESEPDFEDILF